jgi:DNA-binding response OmpR family regulator
MRDMQNRIVIIEDEIDIVDFVCYSFRKEGFEVASFNNGQDGMRHLIQHGADLVLLDIMLPEEDGLSICRRIRSDDRLAALPVIFLTAKGEEIDRVLGLELGADDYVVKPFSPRELVARVRALLRRRERSDEKEEVLEVGVIRLNARTHDVHVKDRKVELSSREYRLLQVLMSRPQHIFSRERLLELVWEHDRSVRLRTVDVHIRRLREKLEEDPGNPRHLHTLRGSGYSFDPGEPEPTGLRL